jgi:glutamine---fructose-6-phosphate transaminase (isomerizing)
MCGITAVLSKGDGGDEGTRDNITPHVVQSLVMLQNRGYDSVGIGWIGTSGEEPRRLMEEKISGKECADCFEYIAETAKGVSADVMIGHTRWATHGGKKKINAHPHISMGGLFMLVHNGIIENYMILKEELVREEYRFVSQTDSEVIVNLIEYYYQKYRVRSEEGYELLVGESACEKAIERATSRLEGTYGLTILSRQTPDKIYVIRNGSPLIYAENDEMVMISSEPNGLCGIFSNYYVLDPKELFVIGRKGLVHTTRFQGKVPKKLQEEKDLALSGYAHYMLKEILNQPKTVLNAINHGGRICDDVVKLGGLDQKAGILREVDHIVLLGCGTSYHAGLIGRHYFQQFRCMKSIQVFDGGEFVEEDLPMDGVVCVILCSQSGETLDLYKALKRVQKCDDGMGGGGAGASRKRKIITCGVVNVVDSLIAREVDCGVYLNAGREFAVASTKAFTSMCVVLSLIAMWFYQLKQGTGAGGGSGDMKIQHYLTSLRSLHYKIEMLLSNLHLGPFGLSTYYSMFDHPHLFILGKGKFEAIAREASLKIKEVSYIHSEAYSGSSLKHGPFALLEEGFPVILLIDRENEAKMMNVYQEVRARDAEVLVITNIPELNVLHKLEVPYIDHYDEILYIVLLQYLAYGLSTHRGYNPDKPRNLAKVVTVE